MTPYEQFRQFLASASHGVFYPTRQAMWCGCLELYPGEESARTAQEGGL